MHAELRGNKQITCTNQRVPQRHLNCIPHLQHRWEFLSAIALCTCARQPDPLCRTRFHYLLTAVATAWAPYLEDRTDSFVDGVREGPVSRNTD